MILDGGFRSTNVREEEKVLRKRPRLQPLRGHCYHSRLPNLLPVRKSQIALDTRDTKLPFLAISFVPKLGDFLLTLAADRNAVNPDYIPLREPFSTTVAISPMPRLGCGLDPYIIRHCQPSVSSLRFQFLSFQFLSFHSDSKAWIFNQNR